MAARKKVAKVAKRVVAKKPPARKAVKKSAGKTTKNVPRAAKASHRQKAATCQTQGSRGARRVKVAADARLDFLFQKDYQAREIFDFLKVQTLRELEEHAPQDIIDRLTGPMVQTVQRIRKTLALVHRHLAKDEKFAKEFLAEVSRG